jgi:hypothetical protein
MNFFYWRPICGEARKVWKFFGEENWEKFNVLVADD